MNKIEANQNTFNIWEYKERLERIPPQIWPLSSRERTILNQKIDTLHLDPQWKSTDEEIIHPDVQEIFDRFTQLELKDKVDLMQQLSNTKYKNHEIYYFLPSRIISRKYPLREWINYREHTNERILTLQALRFVIDLWKTKEKLSPQYEYIVCKDVNCLITELQRLSANVQKFFLVHMSQAESLKGDHSVPLLINKESDQMEIIITDSAGTAQPFLELLAKFIHSHFSEATIYGSSCARQRNSHSCAQFVLNDMRIMSQNVEGFLQFVHSQELRSIPNAPYKLFDDLPIEMLKLSQTGAMLKKILTEPRYAELADKLQRKEFLIMQGNQPLIEEWKQKGLLVTDRQIANTTSIYANHQFAKIERMLLEKTFS